MKLGSGEHYGWEQPRTAEIVHVLAGMHYPDEFAWIRVPAGAKGGPLDVIVRPREGESRWRSLAPKQRVQVGAWQLSESDVEDLQLLIETEAAPSWSPPSPLPNLWLWVEG